MPAYSSLPPTGTMSAYGSQPSSMPTTALPSLPPAQPFRNTLTGALGPYSLPSAPAYPSTMTGNYKPLPPMRPLETLARRGHPRWGLRFLMLLIVAGGATYFLRPYISWIDNRVTPVENRMREIAAQYGLSDVLARVLPDQKAKPAPVAAAPAAPAAPVARGESTRAAPAPVPAAKPAAAKAPGARPDIEPISPRGARGAGAHAGLKPVGRAAALKQQATQRRVAAREAAYARRAAAVARWRASAAKRRMALAAPRVREPAMPSDEDIGGERVAPAPAPAPAPAAPVAAAAPVEAPAPKPVVAAPAPVEKGPPPRSTAVLVKEASSSGDELERLMAGAVTSEKAAPARRGDRMTAEIDRKIADVEKGGVQPSSGRLRPAAATASNAQPLSTGDIKTVMSGVQKQMNTCFRQHGKAGQADVKVEVAPDGSVPGALIRGEFAGTPTGACVQAKIKEATFPASSGLRFDYRLSVR
jgi:hypothetical protein